jgi:hypothetical protein
MRKCGLIVLFLLTGYQLQAQILKEFFLQKKTQIEYLVQQIAALQVYMSYVERGYKITKEGLTTIGNLKDGEFGLHDAYYNSLKNISPVVAHDVRIAEIIAFQVAIVKQYKNCFDQVMQSGYFRAGEINYVSKVFTVLAGDVVNDISALIALTTAGKLQLSDEERMKRLDELYKDIQDKYAFVQSFSRQTSLVALGRMKEQNDARTVGSFYHLQQEK